MREHSLPADTPLRGPCHTAAQEALGESRTGLGSHPQALPLRRVLQDTSLGAAEVLVQGQAGDASENGCGEVHLRQSSL